MPRSYGAEVDAELDRLLAGREPVWDAADEIVNYDPPAEDATLSAILDRTYAEHIGTPAAEEAQRKKERRDADARALADWYAIHGTDRD